MTARDAPQAVPFLRALIHQKLGHAEAARECFARGLEEWTQLVGDDQQAWKDSDVQRWRTAIDMAVRMRGATRLIAIASARSVPLRTSTSIALTCASAA